MVPPARKNIFKKIAAGQHTFGVFIRKPDALGANLEIHCHGPQIAKKKYLSLKIAHLLFPENFPNPVGVEGNTVHTRFIAPNKEVREYHKRYIANLEGDRTPYLVENALRAMYDKYFAHVQEMRKVSDEIEKSGISLDLGAQNVGIRKNRFVFYDIYKINEIKVLEAMDRLEIPEEKKRAVRHFLERYSAACFVRDFD